MELLACVATAEMTNKQLKAGNCHKLSMTVNTFFTATSVINSFVFQKHPCMPTTSCMVIPTHTTFRSFVRTHHHRSSIFVSVVGLRNCM